MRRSQQHGHDHDYGPDDDHNPDHAYESAYEPYEPYPPHEPMDPNEPHRPRPRRGGRRVTAVAVAALLTLTLLPVAADRFVAARIESRTAKAFQEGMDTPVEPEVHVRGFPVVTQAASGTLDHVDITAHDIPARGTTRPLPVSELSLQLDGLTKSDDDSEARARSAQATAFLSYADVSNALGLEISQGRRPGRVSAVVLLPLGEEVTVTTTVSADSANRIAFDDFTVSGGALPAVGSAVLDKVFERPIQLRNIPEGLHLRSVTPTADGLSARFSGRAVTFRPEKESQGDA
ncbi:DUF2993 domain-containing protein [Streptomyces sp. NPDC056468]|uniref:LmeA family phospholipid-binding protein n=1 Tax=Streptomyces sp. NPDC056468 TaxID=3345830 RepID=UPI0036A5B94A